MALIQLKSPTVQVPGEVDVLALRKQAIEAGVRAGVIPQSLAAQLLAITDLNTLPVPVVQGQSSQVTVDGAQGTLISSKEGHLALIWSRTASSTQPSPPASRRTSCSRPSGPAPSPPYAR